MVFLTFLLAAGFAIIHLFAGRLRFLDVLPRSIWLSAAGGIAVAYVFVHLLPEFVEWQVMVARGAMSRIPFLERHAYLLALAGLVLFYGLERASKRSRGDDPEVEQDEGEVTEAKTSGSIFWLHMATYGLYNGLIGYLLLHRDDPDVRNLIFFAIAMAFHFLTNDYGLREDHKKNYHDIGRWILAAAVLAGWCIGLVTEIDEGTLALLFAFLAGGIILNVLKEELPAERQSRFWPFALGAAAYTALLLSF